MLSLDSLFALPVNVLFQVVNDWLPLSVLGKLDRATLGTPKRPDYLKFLSAPEHVFSAECRARDYRLESYMRWVLLRQAKVVDAQLPSSGIRVDMALVNAFFKFTGRYLKRIKCDEGPSSILAVVCPYIQAECSALETLIVRHIEPSSVLIQILRSCRATIRELDLDGSRDTDTTVDMEDMNFICPNMRSLTICDNNFSYFNVVVVRTCPNLQVLRVHPCTLLGSRRNPAPEGLPFISGLVHQNERMRELDVSGTSITDTGLQGLAGRCPNLTRFAVKNCSKLTDTGITSLTNACKHLQYIDISSNSSFSDNSLAAIAETYGAALTKLNVALCSRITGAGLSALLMRCRHLQSLDVGFDSQLSEAQSLECLIHCTELVELNVDDLVTDKVLCAINVHCPQLRRLSMRRLNGFTAAGVFAFLRDAKQLRELVVTENCTVVNQLGKLMIEHCYPALKLSGVAASGYVPRVPRAEQFDEFHVLGDLEEVDFNEFDMGGGYY